MSKRIRALSRKRETTEPARTPQPEPKTAFRAESLAPLPPGHGHDFRKIAIYPKLEVNTPGDQYEHEADQTASQVVAQIARADQQPMQREDEEDNVQRKPLDTPLQSVLRQSLGEPMQRAESAPHSKGCGCPHCAGVGVQRKGAEKDEIQTKPETSLLKIVQRVHAPENEEELQRKPLIQRAPADGGFAVEPQVEQNIESARGGGSLLSGEVRRPMEQAFGADFSGVRVHTDGQSDQLNRSVSARAFTTGSDIFFRSGEYAPGSQSGQELLAHELTHVVQQNGVGRMALQRQQEAGSASDESSAQPTLVVQDDFVPAEFEAQPDEHMHLAEAGSGDGVAHFDSEGSGAHEEKEVAAPPMGRFTDLGRVGTGRYGDPMASGDPRPHAFTDGGRTATAVWGGGGGAGAKGNEAAGSVQSQVSPSYKSHSNGLTSNSDAWIGAGTGTLDVTRSWTGINAGDQGNGWYMTAGATARINQHEVLHVNSSQGHYNTHIVPLLARVAPYVENTAGTQSKKSAFTQLGAILDLRSEIKWGDSVQDFQKVDRDDNKPMGKVDTDDLASGTYPTDIGPGTVGGIAYQHRARLPSEPDPA